MVGETWYGKTSTNKVEYYNKLPSLYMQAKLLFSCHVWKPIKLANVMGATISASVQLFISSFLTHFHILMRQHSSSRIRTVGCIIVCLIWRYACCQRRYQGVHSGNGVLVGVARPLLSWVPNLLISESAHLCAAFVAFGHFATLPPCFMIYASVSLENSSVAFPCVS